MGVAAAVHLVAGAVSAAGMWWPADNNKDSHRAQPTRLTGAAALLVRDGATVEATGGVLAEPGKPVQFCPNESAELGGRGRRGERRCRGGTARAARQVRPEHLRGASCTHRRSGAPGQAAVDRLQKDSHNGIYSSGESGFGPISVGLVVLDQRLYDLLEPIGLSYSSFNPWLRPVT